MTDDRLASAYPRGQSPSQATFHPPATAGLRLAGIGAAASAEDMENSTQEAEKLTRGRKPNNEPATAYDYRRYITLVQVLAHSGSDEGIRALCEKWGIEIIEDRSEPPYKGRYYMNQWATIRKLAQHVIEYHRST